MRVRYFNRHKTKLSHLTGYENVQVNFAELGTRWSDAERVSEPIKEFAVSTTEQYLNQGGRAKTN